MKLIYGLTTYNRLDYLKHHIETWYKTINKTYDWTLYINDDGSKDGSVEYLKELKLDKINIVKNFAKRRGVHFGINKILKYSEEHDFDYGFKSEDDVFFERRGWEDLYVTAIQKSGYHHLSFADIKWAQKYNKNILLMSPMIVEKKLIQANISSAYCSYGCFWTYTKQIIKKIGYIDVENFSLCGNGHSDWTLRACDEGFNTRKPIYDALNSNSYIKMQLKNYRCAANSKEREFASNIGVKRGHKGKVLDRRNRGYIPYRELGINMMGEKII